jgi:hypothetical protein
LAEDTSSLDVVSEFLYLSIAEANQLSGKSIVRKGEFFLDLLAKAVQPNRDLFPPGFRE